MFFSFCMSSAVGGEYKCTVYVCGTIKPFSLHAYMSEVISVMVLYRGAFKGNVHVHMKYTHICLHQSMHCMSTAFTHGTYMYMLKLECIETVQFVIGN